jgi:hypothetical protein
MREAPDSSVDMHDLTGDVARARRAQERHENAQIMRLTDIAHGAILRNPGFARFLRRKDTLVDLLGVETAWDDAVHRDAIPGDGARQGLGPDVRCAVRRIRGIDDRRLVSAGDVDDPAELSL